jgi:hypothetical protein
MAALMDFRPKLSKSDVAWGKVLQQELSEVVLVVSSSRGGSSVFTEYLRHSNALLHLRGELNPWLQQSGLVFPFSGTGSDALFPEHLGEKESSLWGWLGTEVGNMDNTEQGWAGFSQHLQRRLQMQWPEKPIPHGLVNDAVESILNEQPALATLLPTSPERFHLALIQKLQAKGLSHVLPHWYDIAAESITEWGWDIESLGPTPQLIEEPPLVLITPWRRPSREDLRNKPLVIKTPSNAYRLDFLRSFFKNQRLRIIHLKREPAAAINGLYDGWRYPRGFHAHRIQSCQPKRCEEKGPHPTPGIWKYDLPPKWESVQRSMLVEICTFQWLSAHQHILASTVAQDDRFGVWFEELLGPENRRAIDRVIKWLGITPDHHLLNNVLEDLPPIMATQRPRRSRWFARAALIQPQLERAEVQDTWGQLKDV